MVRYLEIDGRRIISVQGSQSPKSKTRSAIVKAFLGPMAYIGEVLRFFYHGQDRLEGTGVDLLAEMRWLVPASSAPLPYNPWTDL
jgi:hypothetical protein